MDRIEGGCLCGAVRFSISGTPLATSICHCASCRRASGAPAVAWVVVDAADFGFVAGRPVAFRSSPPVVRTFCGSCGTPLTYQHDESPDTIDVTTASFDYGTICPRAGNLARTQACLAAGKRRPATFSEN